MHKDEFEQKEDDGDQDVDRIKDDTTQEENQSHMQSLDKEDSNGKEDADIVDQIDEQFENNDEDGEENTTWTTTSKIYQKMN